MEVTREYILQLDKQRLKLEKEISEITEYLNQDGMPGVDKSLIDREGFPIPNVDLMDVRTMRHKLICTQNDLKNLMLSIETNMQLFFKKEKENKTITPKKEYIDKTEPIMIQVFEDAPKIKKTNLKIPFAWVNLVIEGSPAEEAGLKVGDGILSFDGTLQYGIDKNPLVKIGQIVNEKIDTELDVEILRKSNEGVEENIHLKLIPHKWSGQGVLGCKLNLTE